MMQWLDWLDGVMAPHPRLYVALMLAGLILAAWLANFVTKKVLLRALGRSLRVLMAATDTNIPHEFRLGVIPRLANIVPALVLMAGVVMIPGLSPMVVELIEKIGTCFIILTLAMALARAMDLTQVIYQRRARAPERSIKGYLQLIKIITYAIAAVLIVAVLIERSPLLLLSGMGALMAVLMLVFQDTLLSLVAGVTVGSNDMIRIGDWIEMPSANADGDVVDISLHAVRVQNWDKSITAIPMKRFLSDSFRNWRGMREAGGRRIKRALWLDQTSVHFLVAAELETLSSLKLMAPYVQSKQDELASWNAALGEWAVREAANTRRLTNLGSFRAYVLRYLREHPGVNQSMTVMVRQLPPDATGLPLELYCFTQQTDWAVYEDVQSDIFDHLLAVLPMFGLRVFQNPSGHDVRVLVSAPEA